MTEKISLQECADNMAEAIREWNAAKLERESWKPVPGQVPPVGILGSAKKANAMLSKALADYEAFQHRLALGQALTCPECDSVLDDRGYCMMGHWVGTPAGKA